MIQTEPANTPVRTTLLTVPFAAAYAKALRKRLHSGRNDSKAGKKRLAPTNAPLDVGFHRPAGNRHAFRYETGSRVYLQSCRRPQQSFHEKFIYVKIKNSFLLIFLSMD